MTFVRVSQTTMLLFSIYSKGEKENISDKEIEVLLKGYLKLALWLVLKYLKLGKKQLTRLL